MQRCGRLVPVRLVVLATAMLVGVVGPSVAKTTHPKLVTIHARFHRVATGVAGVTASGRYAFFFKDVYAPRPLGPALVGTAGKLIDEKASTRISLNPPNCPGVFPTPVFGDHWLMFDCDVPDTAALYDLSGGQWISVPFGTLGPAGGSCALGNGGGYYCRTVGVGRYWIEWQLSCSEHCQVDHGIQAIYPGLQQGGTPAPGGTTAFDLNALSGVRTLCPPLTVPTHTYSDVGPNAGTIRFLGQFAILDGNGFSLARCGSRLNRNLPNLNGQPPVASPKEIVWLTLARVGTLTRPGRWGIAGLWLPSLRRFTVVLPPRVARSVPGASYPTLALSKRTLYFLNGGRLWATAAPSPRH